LSSKTSTIESLELELSSAQTQLSNAESTISTRDAELAELRSQIATLEASAKETADQITELQSQLSANAKDSSESSQGSKEAESRIALLTSQLATSQRDASASAARIAALEKKAETLTTLHKEAEARHQSRVEALVTENAKIKRDATSRSHRTASAAQGVDADDAVLEDLEDESRAELERRIRALEEENSDLKRGMWRDRRREMQPGMHDGGDGSNGFDEVDLSSGGGFLGSPVGRRGSTRSPYRGTSTFSDVLNSGISAFTGQSSPAMGRRRGESAAGVGGPRKASLGLLEDEDEFAFDEDAFRKAQEEEGRKRIERVREVTRGLEGWRGWRVDLVDVRGGVGAGVFDV
jgi:hypothetical protein